MTFRMITILSSEHTSLELTRSWTEAHQGKHINQKAKIFSSIFINSLKLHSVDDVVLQRIRYVWTNF